MAKLMWSASVKGRFADSSRGNVGARDIGNLRTKLHYLGIDLVKKWQIARINVVKRALNLRKRNLIGTVRKTNASPQRHKLGSLIVNKQGGIVINALNDLMMPPKIGAAEGQAQ